MARTASPRDAEVCADRLKGNGAWNGQGLLTFLAMTSRKDKVRADLEPLKALCEAVVYPYEDNEPMAELTDEQEAIVDAMLVYSNEFHDAIAANAE